MNRWTSDFGHNVLGLLFPSTCLSCQNIVAEQGTLCAQCWSGLHFIEKPYCAITGRPFSVDFGPAAISPAALADPPHYTTARAAALHTKIARKLVTRLKYGDRTDLAPWMARWMIRAGFEQIKDADVVIPVPLHRLRHLSRRYNQSAELARTIAAKSNLDFAPGALRRIKPTKQQVGLNERQRQENVRGAFKVPAAEEINIRGRNVLLIDDVMTTGATANTATRCLRKAGALKVHVLTFSQVVPEFSPLT